MRRGESNPDLASLRSASSKRISHGLNARASLCEDDIFSMSFQTAQITKKHDIQTSSDVVFFGEPIRDQIERNWLHLSLLNSLIMWVKSLKTILFPFLWYRIIFLAIAFNSLDNALDTVTGTVLCSILYSQAIYSSVTGQMFCNKKALSLPFTYPNLIPS